MGFWSDANYLVDTPMNLKKGSPGYDFEDRVMALYADAVSKFNSARETQIMQPFGCDMAYMDASVNYLIMDELLYVWEELGIDEDIKLVYSTPTKFYDELKKDNRYIKENGGWPVRKDDLFPVEDPENKSYLSGYYSVRPSLKQAYRKLTTTYHSTSRLLAQQMLRHDLQV
jgi:hypothetical protein